MHNCRVRINTFNNVPTYCNVKDYVNTRSAIDAGAYVEEMIQNTCIQW